jgi:hypothetical protein
VAARATGPPNIFLKPIRKTASRSINPFLKLASQHSARYYDKVPCIRVWGDCKKPRKTVKAKVESSMHCIYKSTLLEICVWTHSPSAEDISHYHSQVCRETLKELFRGQILFLSCLGNALNNAFHFHILKLNVLTPLQHYLLSKTFSI